MTKTAVPEPAADLPSLPAAFGLKPRANYLPWSHAVERLEKALNYWIVSVSPDGRPHAMPVVGFFLEGAIYWRTGRETFKWRNLERNPNIVIHLESGADAVIVEGEAEDIAPTIDAELLAKLKAASQEKYGAWLPLDRQKHALVRVRPRKVLAWSGQNMQETATRWRFPKS